jgi:two-component system NarL family sensor kinase
VLGALDAGADDYLSKPVTLADLRSRILAATRIVSLDGVDTTRVEHVPSGELERKIAELEESRARIVRVQESVRDEIAADLHDHVQTQLSLLYFRLLDIKYMVEPADAKAAYEIDQLAEELDLLRENAIRKLSQRLYPSKVRIGLIPGLRDLQDRHDGQLPIDLTVTPEVYAMEPAGESRIPFNTRLALYRIADEAVTNAVRHSHAARASIRLDSREQSLIISIEDNGSGFDTAATGKGLGIATMRDYVETLRGSFQLQSAPGSGTKITASVPLQQ